METNLFTVPVADLERGPQKISHEIPLGWQKQVFKESEAEPETVGLLSVELIKNGSRVVVRGKAESRVTMTCSRSLEPVSVDLCSDIFLILSKAYDATVDKPKTRKRRRKERPRASQPKKSGWESDPELEEDQAAVDTYEGKNVILDGFVREFLLLELPLVPVRDDLPANKIPAMATLPRESEGTIDPRLAPLAALRERMGQDGTK